MSEPKYKYGHVYKDADGSLFMRVADIEYPWRYLDFAMRTVEPRSGCVPKRPLVRLVPEND